MKANKKSTKSALRVVRDCDVTLKLAKNQSVVDYEKELNRMKKCKSIPIPSAKQDFSTTKDSVSKGIFDAFGVSEVGKINPITSDKKIQIVQENLELLNKAKDACVDCVELLKMKTPHYKKGEYEIGVALCNEFGTEPFENPKAEERIDWKELGAEYENFLSKNECQFDVILHGPSTYELIARGTGIKNACQNAVWSLESSILRLSRELSARKFFLEKLKSRLDGEGKRKAKKTKSGR